ncbi:MAG: ornithine cyclodeaminase family protein, partial [Roseiarcus sp.]
MRVFSAEDIDRSLDFPSLVDALSEAMRGGFIAPARHHHEIERAGEKPAIQLLMPAWTESASRAGLYLGAKIVNVFPGNSARDLPTVMGTYVLQSGRTGATLAALDGTRLTHWRTAAASALAARHLA